jgi:hypothetical protein
MSRTAPSHVGKIKTLRLVSAWHAAWTGSPTMIRPSILSVLLTAACLGDESAPALDPTTCPAAPFEQCGVRDGGWDLSCDGGVIFEQSHNGGLYCAPDSFEVVCESTDPTPRAVHSCASVACNADPMMRRKYLETYDEYTAFDPAMLCAP